jgi:hypothetical protein
MRAVQHCKHSDNMPTHCVLVYYVEVDTATVTSNRVLTCTGGSAGEAGAPAESAAHTMAAAGHTAAAGQGHRALLRRL